MRDRALRLLLAVSLCAAPLAIAVPAAADEDCPWCVGLGDDVDDTPTTPVTQPSGYAWYDFGLDYDDDDHLCWYPEFLGYRPDPPPADQTYEYVIGRIEEWTSDDVGPTRCPFDDPAIDPAELAREFWLSVVPPASTPRIDPGEALAGLRTYLVLDGETTVSETDVTPIGTLAINGRVSYEVDWGDGSPVTTTGSQGVPYPGGVGEITHAYTRAGTYTVTVVSVWSGTWTAGGASGELPVLRREASITLPVTERQAVRTN